jgi:hypothetical protein
MLFYAVFIIRQFCAVFVVRYAISWCIRRPSRCYDEFASSLRLSGCGTVYEFCCRVAVASGKSAEPILHRESSLLKHHSDAMGEFKN